MNSVCGVCLDIVPARIQQTRRGVFLLRSCPEHGDERLLVESCPSLFDRQVSARAMRTSKSDVQVIQFARASFTVPAVPAGMVLELTDDCNETCTTCIAGSFRGAGNYKSVEQLKVMINAAIPDRSDPPIVFVSGGEPTIHPDMFEVIDRIYRAGAKHVVLITNGRVIAEDPGFARILKDRCPRLEVFLQFDSLDRDVLLEIRGRDLSNLRRIATERLAKADVLTTLVCVVKNGRSEELLGETVEFAATFPNIRGVNFQPLRATGRHGSGAVYSEIAPTMGRLIRLLAGQVPFVKQSAMAPHPVSAGSIAVGYWDRARSMEEVTNQVLVSGAAKGERTPLLETIEERSGVFRLMIVNYMDRYCLRTDLVEDSQVFVMTSSGRALPLDLYYLMGEPVTPTVVRMRLGSTA